MSEIFQKSCYTSRSSGYKYRTLSTNTGERKRRHCDEDNTFDRKLGELQHEIISRIDNQLELTQNARNSIQEKFGKIDAKINSMLELKETVTALQKDLQVAETSLAEMLEKVYKMEGALGTAGTSLSSRKNSFRAAPIFEEKEVLSSNTTHI